MTISEMHILFRTLTQQMGMQKVRAILPESIDTFINNAIISLIQVEIQSTASNSFKENVATQRNKISTPNALSTIYIQEVKDIVFAEDVGENSIVLNMNHTPMYFLDFSVARPNKPFISCRWIEADKLEETVTDYCSRDSGRHPIVTMTSIVQEDAPVILCNLFTGGHNLDFDRIKVGYVRMPNKVRLSQNSSNESIDCDLPEYLHNNIVELAVQLYMQSLGLTSNRQASQQSNKQN